MNSSKFKFLQFVLLHIVLSRDIPAERPSHVLRSRDAEVMEMIDNSNLRLRFAMGIELQGKSQDNFNVERGEYLNIYTTKGRNRLCKLKNDVKVFN